MGDKKPKKNSSGTGDAYKAKQAKNVSERPIIAAPGTEKPKNKPK